MQIRDKVGPVDWAVRIASQAMLSGMRLTNRNEKWRFDRLAKSVSDRWPALFGKTYFGSFILCELKDFIGVRIFFFGIWEPNISAVFHDELSSGDYVVDIGANIGYDTLLASKIVGPTGRVIAIEAAPSIFDRLSRNLALNKVGNVRRVNIAISDSAGEIELFAEEGNLGRTSTLQRGHAKKVEKVATLPLDQVLSTDELARIKFIKIDIEGGEILLLERLINTLEIYPTDVRLIVELSEDDSGRTRRVFDDLLAKGFRAFAIENDYSIESYLASGVAVKPRQISSLPSGQVDVLFKR